MPVQHTTIGASALGKIHPPSQVGSCWPRGPRYAKIRTLPGSALRILPGISYDRSYCSRFAYGGRPMKIRILGVPLDLGQERRGVDMGPSAVRAAGLNQALKNLGHQVEDAGNIHVKLPEEQHFGDRRANT